VDREFALQLPPEPRRITISGLPAGYSIKSLTLQSSSGAGAIDLMPLVRSQEAIPLNAGDSVRVALTLSASPGAGVKVSGRVTNPRGSRIESSTVRISGMAIAENRDLTPVREAAARGVALTNPDIAGQLEVAVSADGSFEFSTVPPGTYDLTVPGNSWASSRQVIVGAEDVTNVVIEAPPTKVVPGQLVIEGVAGIPFDDKWPIWISVGSGNSVGSGSVLGTRGAGDGLIAPNGSFTIRVPEKEHQIRVTLGSPGYAVKAVEYGKTDVLKNPVKLDSSPAELLRITLAPVRTFVVPVIFHRGQPARLGTPQIGPSGLTEPSGVTAPELLRAVAPQYSEARINAIGTANLAFTGPAAFVDTPGSLWLDATIQHDGTVVPNGNLKTGARGNSSADPLIQAIQKSEFKPATKNGAPTDARVQIEMRGVVE
jgi:hypothetical protein